MAKKYVYTKDTTGFGDFVYVDLLPDVRRSSQFNMNVIVALLFAIILMFFFIYRPYSAGLVELERVNSINNDYLHELTLTNEEFVGYEINLDAIAFEEDIETASKLRVNFNNLVDDIDIIVNLNSGRIRSVTYNAELKELVVDVSLQDAFGFNVINNQIINLSWVDSVFKSDEVKYAGETLHTSSFVIGVDYNVE